MMHGQNHIKKGEKYRCKPQGFCGAGAERTFLVIPLQSTLQGLGEEQDSV